MSCEQEERVRKPRWVLRSIPMALFWGALIFAVAMALIPQPPPLPVETSDKILHMFAFGMLTLLCVVAYPNASLIIILIVLTALGGLIELIQGTAIVNRQASLPDWLADVLAILPVVIGFALFRAVRHLSH